MALELLEDYKNNASLVITSRIHCAMPCVAMRIPVIFLFSKQNSDDYRVKIIDDIIGINYINERLLFLKPVQKYYMKKINWLPEVVDIELEKKNIKERYHQAVEKAIIDYKENFG